MRQLLVIEDGDEYEAFARLFLAAQFKITAAHSANEALTRLMHQPVEAFLIDLRFDRSPEDELVGEIEETAQRLFAGDRAAAVDYLKQHQGTFVLAELRKSGYLQRAVFVHDFAPQRLKNLQRLYGDVVAVGSFDANAILAALAS